MLLKTRICEHVRCLKHRILFLSSKPVFVQIQNHHSRWRFHSADMVQSLFCVSVPFLQQDVNRLVISTQLTETFGKLQERHLDSEAIRRSPLRAETWAR